jgi:hypothetical protein
MDNTSGPTQIYAILSKVKFGTEESLGNSKVAHGHYEKDVQNHGTKITTELRPFFTEFTRNIAVFPCVFNNYIT